MEMLMLMSIVELIRSRIRLALVGISLALVAVACGSVAAAPPIPPDGPLVQQLTGDVSDARAMKHLQALQKIADEHGGNRAAGTAGYDASVEYVARVLRNAGFKISTRTYEASGGLHRRRACEPESIVFAQSRTGDPS
jgi:aminopeptidase S